MYVNGPPHVGQTCVPGGGGGGGVSFSFHVRMPSEITSFADSFEYPIMNARMEMLVRTPPIAARAIPTMAKGAEGIGMPKGPLDHTIICVRAMPITTNIIPPIARNIQVFAFINAFSPIFIIRANHSVIYKT